MAERAIQNTIEVDHVSKMFDGRPAVTDITFHVPPGEIFGLIGPSGSGKTTLVLMMVGVVVPTKGEVRVLGVPPSKFSTRDRELVGYMPQGAFLYPTLTTWENLTHVAGIYGIGWFRRRKAIRHVLEELGLWEDRNKRAGALSGGMLRRLHLATVLLHNPQVAFIDEPMEGLDPLLRQEVWDILQGMKNRGQTVFMTTHSMDEAERCDSLALISGGNLIAHGTPAELRSRAFGGEIVRLRLSDFDSRIYHALRSLPGVKELSVARGNEISLLVEDAKDTMERASAILDNMDTTIVSSEHHVPSFNDVFAGLIVNA